MTAFDNQTGSKARQVLKATGISRWVIKPCAVRPAFILSRQDLSQSTNAPFHLCYPFYHLRGHRRVRVTDRHD